MDDTLLLYRNAKVGDTAAYDYTAKIFVPNIISAATALSMGLQNGDKFIQGNSGSPTGIYQLVTLDNTVPAGMTSVSLTNKVVYCEADMCFYKFTSTTVNSTTIYLYEIYQPYVPFNYHNTSEQIALKDFTYTAERMGKTPTLTADFYDKECYDNLWDNDTTTPKYRFSDIFTIFRGERYYFKLTPQSQIQNTDARYKHSINFVSEREKIEHAKMFDVVTTSTPDSPVSDSSKFVFYGTLSEFADRINASLIKEGVTFATTYNGITVFSGYHVEIKIKDGNNGGIDSSMLTKAATVSIENNSILEALGHLDTDYGVSYYVDGYTIWIADFEADLTGTGHPAIQYGEENSLLQITRQNVTKNVVTRITGYGSEDNIPYYYPNPCESGFLGTKFDKYGEPVVNIAPYSSSLPTGRSVGERTIKKGQSGSDGQIYEYNGSSWISIRGVTKGVVYKNVTDGKYYVCSVSDASWSEVSTPIAAHPYEWVKSGNNVIPATRLIYISQSSTTNGYLPSYADEGDKCYVGRRSTGGSYVYRKIYTYTNGEWDNGVTPTIGECFICNGSLYMYSNNTMYKKDGDYDKYIQLAKSDILEYGTPKRLFCNVSEVKFDSIYNKYYIDIEVYADFDEIKTTFVYFGYGFPIIGEATPIVLTSDCNNYSSIGSGIWRNEIEFRDDKIRLKFKQYMNFNPSLDIKYGRYYPYGHYKVGHNWVDGYTLYRDIEENFYEGNAPQVWCSTTWGIYELPNNSEWMITPSADQAYRGYYHNESSFGESHTSASGVNTLPRVNGALYIDTETNQAYTWNGSSFITTSAAITDSLIQLVGDGKGGVRTIDAWYYEKKWKINGNETTLDTHGLSIISGTPMRGDKVSFEQIKYMQPQKNLMPSIYYNSDAKKRFFDAISYPHSKVRGTVVDREIGEYYIDDGTILDPDRGKVMNTNYESGVNVGYTFENFIDKGHPRTHVEVIDAIKPSIEDLTVTVNGVELNADMFADFCYDLLDNDDNWSVWERQDEDDSNLTLKHAHFFAKLRPLGFNLFAMAIDEAEMTVNFTSGCCMACTFKIKVDKDSKRNPIALYSSNIYRRDDDGVLTYDDAHLFAAAGTPTRYSDRQLYTYSNGAFVEYGTATQYAPPRNANDEMIHFDGDVITSNSESDVQDSQNDTTSNYVWIALEKDVSTFSYPMPSVSNNMKPVKVSTPTSNDGDKFVLTHIKIPLRFVRAAEERLSKALVEYMSANNAELFHYSIKFSRIFLEESGNTYATDLNENVKLHIQYADHDNKSFYVKSYTYKKVGNKPLPEISVELRENINVARYRYYNRWEFNRWDKEWSEVRREIDPIIRGVLGQGNGNGMSLVNGNMLSVLSRSLVSRNGSTMRGTLNTALKGKVMGNLSIVRDNGVEMPVRDIDLNVGIDEDSGLRGKTKNLLTDLGILNFDETKNYDVDEMCVYEGRLMRFTQKKTAGVWDATKATNDSVSNCIFRALGVQEYNASRTTTYNKGDKFYRNNKVYRVDTAFTPMVSGTPVTESVFTRCAKQLDIVEFFAEKNFTETLNSTVTELSRIANNLNEQILGGDSGLAVIVAAVNEKLADLTAAMVTENNITRQYVSALAKALADNEVLQNDQGVVSTSQTLTDYLDQTSAVSTNANAAHTAITGANTESVYNKLLAYIADKMFGQKVSDVHTEGGSDDSAYAITLKLYDTSQYMSGVPVEFSKDSAYQSGQMLIHLKHIYALNADKASGVDWDGIDPSDLENADAMLQKAVIFTTDTYDVSNGRTPFLAYGMYLMAAAFGEYVQKFVSDSGDNGVIYAKLAETIKENTKEYVDGSDRNMFTEHTAVSSAGTTYTVLQYAIMRLEMNGYLFAASMYDKELNKDDDHHIIFAIEPMKKMCDYFVEFMQQQGTKEVTIGGETVTCYYAENSTIADKFGYNYLYSADYLVYTGVMYYNSDNKEYYLPVG